MIVTATVEPTENDRAYMAGIMDGEGSVQVRYRSAANQRCFDMALSIANTDKPLIDWIAQRWSGSVHVLDRPDTPYKTQWIWRASARRAVIKALSDIRPFLIIKSERARLLFALASRLETQPNPTSRGLEPEELRMRQSICDQVRLLNRRGRVA